jgi:serine/threonine-protein kinase
MHDDDDRDPDLDRVVAAVSSGDPIDWASEAAHRPELGALLEELRLVESVAVRHRRAADAPEAPEPVTWGPLRVVGRIGRGGSSQVYRAFDPRLQTEVALKLTLPGVPSGTRIVEEGRRMARVRHVNVLTVHGADEHEGRAGIWTDLIEGQNLEEMIAAGGPLGAAEAARIGLDLCRALAAVHGAGAERHPDDRAALPEDGTPLAMAPEELRGEPPTPASDIYSLGVLLYRLVTRHFPIEARTYDELHARHDRGERTPLRDRRPDLPGGFVRVVERALESRPERRFASAGEFERALLRMGEPEATAPGGPVPWTRRRRATVFAVAGVALAVIVWLVALPPGKPPPAGDGHGNEPVAEPTTPGGGGASSGQGEDATARSTAGPVMASAALVLSRDDQSRALAPGDRVAPGDALSLSFQANEPLHVYVLDEDATGEVYVLFPAPGVDLANPLPPGVLHRLPGARAGQAIRWQVTSAGGKETVIVIATREPFIALEQEIARFPAASPDRPVTYPKLGEGALESLRGIGGMAEAGPGPAEAARSRLSETVRRLAASGRPAAPWTWQIELENPK